MESIEKLKKIQEQKAKLPTNKELAQELGYSESYISKLLTGTRTTKKALERLNNLIKKHLDGN